jgi:hypothetical protein
MAVVEERPGPRITGTDGPEWCLHGEHRRCTPEGIPGRSRRVWAISRGEGPRPGAGRSPARQVSTSGQPPETLTITRVPFSTVKLQFAAGP